MRQRLDDDQPEDPPTREAMLREIIDRTGRAKAALDAQNDRIEALRNLERNALTILASLEAPLAAQELPALRGAGTASALPTWRAMPRPCRPRSRATSRRPERASPARGPR